MLADDPASQGLTFVGRPIEVTRTLNRRYVDEAELDFNKYICNTLAHCQASGGRFNPQGEFGALYTASDEETAWAEIHARFRREGIPGLPPELAMMRLVIMNGLYADLTDTDSCALWDIHQSSLVRDDWAECWNVARAVRAVGDFIQSPSARGSGANIALYPDRGGSELGYRLQSVERHAQAPEAFRQHPHEQW